MGCARMKTKIVYVLVSSEDDIYLEQAYVSMLSAKHHMPDVHITLLTDSKTSESLTGTRKKESAIADEIIVIELDPFISAQKRSRLLKTNVRNYVQGDFLFIDCDTIIVKPLDEIDEIDVDMAACWDTHVPFKDNPYRSMCLKHGTKLEWPIENETEYFNSGVIFVRDIPATHNFFTRWNKNYQDGTLKRVSMDQPSLAKTNYELGHQIKTLPDCWNCEFKHGLRHFKDAKIIHYLCTSENNGKMPPFLLNEKKILLQVKQHGEITPQIEKLFDDPSKGIAPLTCLISGSDVLFFEDPLIVILRSWYDKGKKAYKIISFLVRKCSLIKSKIRNKIKKLF